MRHRDRRRNGHLKGKRRYLARLAKWHNNFIVTIVVKKKIALPYRSDLELNVKSGQLLRQSFRRNSATYFCETNEIIARTILQILTNN